MRSSFRNYRLSLWNINVCSLPLRPSEFGFSAASTVVDPADATMFPGLDWMEAELRSWDWTFGKTPKFSVQTPLHLADGRSARLHMEVKTGRVESCELDVPSDWLPRRLGGELADSLVGERFCPYAAAAAVATLLRSEDGERQRRLHNLCDAVLAVMG